MPPGVFPVPSGTPGSDGDVPWMEISNTSRRGLWDIWKAGWRSHHGSAAGVSPKALPARADLFFPTAGNKYTSSMPFLEGNENFSRSPSWSGTAGSAAPASDLHTHVCLMSPGHFGTTCPDRQMSSTCLPLYAFLPFVKRIHAILL